MTRYQNYSQGKSFITFNGLNNDMYYLQSFSIPGFSIGIANQSTGMLDIPLPGSKAEYNTFSCSFVLDEDLNVFADIYNWIFTNQFENNTSDFSLHFYNNNKKKIVKIFDFTGGWVSQENDVEINYANDNTLPLLLNVQFSYAYYTIRNVSND